MGLLESLVNVPEQLRIWHLSGVRYLLLPEDGPATAAPPFEAPDPRSWPEPWARLFAKTPPQPRLVISYGQLGFDLSGRADKRRGALWRRLISDLGLAGRGQVAFWPPALPADDQLLAQPAIFQSGLSLLAPNVVAYFGDPAADGLENEAPDPSTPATGGIRWVLLPDPESLLATDQELWDHVVATLGQSLA